MILCHVHVTKERKKNARIMKKFVASIVASIMDKHLPHRTTSRRRRRRAKKKKGGFRTVFLDFFLFFSSTVGVFTLE